MADNNIKFHERKFLLEKKKVTLEDCKLYIETYHPEKKYWFMDLCLNPHLNEKTQKEELMRWVDIKKKFYEEFFPMEDTMTYRTKLFSDWGDVQPPKSEDADA